MIHPCRNWIVALLLLSGCASEPPRETAKEGVVATFTGGEITTEEMDRHILSISASERRLPGRDLSEWYEELARGLAFEELMGQEAEREGLEQEAPFQEMLDMAHRTLVVEICVAQRHRLEVYQPTEDEVRDAYEARRGELVRVERRQVSNIFVRRDPGESDTALRARLQQLRDRAMGGESFARLAAEYSDSETRHQEGRMGWVARGQLVHALETVIFDLEEGVPSDPILTAEGGHLFLVSEAVERRELSYENARPRLMQAMVQERRQDAIADWEDSLELPVGSILPTQGQLFELVRQGDPEATVLRIGDQEVKLAAFQAQMRQARETEELQSQGQGRGRNERDLLWWVLKQMERRELVYYHCVSEGGLDLEQLQSARQQWLDQALPTVMTQRSLEESLDRQEARLESFYEANPGRFGTPPRWQLRRLTVALEGDINELMHDLEESVESLNEGTLDFAELAGTTGGEIDDLGWRTLGELENLSPRVQRLVSPLRVGDFTPPFTFDNSIMILQAMDRREPESVPFASVRDAVRDQYLTQHRSEVLEELSSAVLEDGAFQVYPENLEALRQTRGLGGVTEDDQLVMEVMELLEELEGSGD